MRVRIVFATWVPLLLLGGGGGALAEPEAPSPSAATPPAAAAPRTPGPVETLPLSLHEALRLGIENNTDVQIVRYDPPIAEYDYEAAWGVHDPTLFGDYFYNSRNIPTASALLQEDPTVSPTETFQLVERENIGSAGLRGLLPRAGWFYEITYSGSRLQSNSPIQSLSTLYNSGLTATVTAPLLKGAWWGAAWTAVEITQIGSELAREEFRQRLTDIVAGIETFYWNLGARKQELEVADKSLKTRRELLRQVQARYEVGVVSGVDVIEAEAGVAEREFNQISAKNRYRNAQDELIDRVYGPRLTATSQLEIEPTDRPESYVTFDVDPELSLQRALERRPELAIAQQRVEQGELELKFRKNERLPQLDLVGSYGTVGIAGKPNADPLFGSPLPDGLVPRDYSGADDFWFDGQDNRIWTGGAVVSIPIPNTSARANVSKSELQLRKALTFVRRTEQDVVKEVRDAVRNLASALEGVEAAERSVKLANEQLRAEKIRLEHGESTPFEVNQREEALVQAEGQRIVALQIYHSSVTALDRAQGTLLEDRGIVLDDALPLR